MINIQWLAHASFLIEGNGLRILTDPFDPEILKVSPLNEQADIVIRSSDDDDAHGFIDTLPGTFELVTATDIVKGGVTTRGLAIKAFWAQESLIHKEHPRDNAMYRFTLDGITITHLGDVGNALTGAQMDTLQGTDVLLALAGGPPTIDLADLWDVIQTIQPKIVIPMHYRIPGPEFFMLPVDDLASYFPEASIIRCEGSTYQLDKDTLPNATQLIILDPAHTPD